MTKKRGFTLVELLVTVSVVLILTGIGSYSIGKFIQTSNLVKSRDYLLSQVKLARNLAVTNQLPNNNLGIAYVRVANNGGNIIVTGINSSGVETTQPPYFSKKLDISDDVEVTLKNGSTAITSFGFLASSGRLTDTSGVCSSGPVTIMLTNGSEEYGLTINDLGIINSND